MLSIQFLCSNLLLKESHAGGGNVKSPGVKLARVAWVPIKRLLDTLLVFNSLQAINIYVVKKMVVK